MSPESDPSQDHPRAILPALFSGLLAGGVNGFLGIGAGFMLVPMLSRAAKLRGSVAMGTALAVTLPAALIGAVQYQVQDWAVVLLVALGCVAGAVLGSRITLGAPAIRRWLGLLLLAGGVGMFLRSPLPVTGPPVAVPLDGVRALLLIGLGLGAGLLSAAVNTGTGVVLVPLLALGAGFTQLEAQGLALAVTVPVSFPGALLHFARGTVASGLLGPLCVGAVAGTALMGYVAHAAGNPTLRLFYALFLILVGLSVVLRRPAPTEPKPPTESGSE